MARLTVRTEALRRAAAAIGGDIRLAKALQISVRQARRWIAGHEYPPVEVYQRALDVLIAVGAN
jgi:hypothetical protein